MKLWGGRFETGPSEVFERFSGSLDFDRRLIDADIRGSQAFARALERVGILTAEERAQIVAAFDAIRAEAANPDFYAGATDEDGTPWLERVAAPTDLRAEVIARADLAVVADAVAKLGAKYPAVFWKRYGEGRTETEIAHELGISVAAVKTRAFRGRQAALRAVAR